MQGQMQTLYAEVQKSSKLAAQSLQAANDRDPSDPLRSRLPKIRVPSVFKGEMGAAAVDEWVSEHEQQHVFYDQQFASEQAKVKYGVAFLGGPALHWWMTEPNKAAIHSWADFVARLYTRFRPVQAAMSARVRLDRLHQRSGQSVNQYTNAFQVILAHIPDMGEAAKVHHYVSGLDKSIAGRVWEKQPSDLKAAVVAAVSVEGMHNFGRSAGVPASYSRFHTSASAASSTSAPMDINAIEAEEYEEEKYSDPPHKSAAAAADPMSLLLAKMEAMEHRILALSGGGHSSSSSSRGGDRVPGLKAGDIDRLRKEGKCFRCKKTGHMKSECPSKPKSGNF